MWEQVGPCPSMERGGKCAEKKKITNHVCRTDIWEEEKYVVINRGKAVNSANSDVRGLSLEITTSKFPCFVFQLVERATDLE